MSISQAGVYSLKLYENKDFEFDYDSNGLIILSSISNTGDTLELETNDNFIKYANALVPAENNTTLNDHTLAFEINGLDQSNLDIIEKLQSSIYGWIALITFMDNQVYLINIPFHPKYDKFDSQVTHTFFVELKPRIFTLEKLEAVVEAQSVEGVLAFDGSSYIEYNQTPDVKGTKTITWYMWLNNESGYDGMPINFVDVVNTDDRFTIYLKGDKIQVNTSDEELGFSLYPLSGLSGKFLFCEVDKEYNAGASSGELIDFRINGVSQTGDKIGASISGVSGKLVGALTSSLRILNDAYIWDITIEGVFNAPGQPDGNTNAAWDDTIGSLTATVSGSPTTINLP